MPCRKHQSRGLRPERIRRNIRVAQSRDQHSALLRQKAAQLRRQFLRLLPHRIRRLLRLQALQRQITPPAAADRGTVFIAVDADLRDLKGCPAPLQGDALRQCFRRPLDRKIRSADLHKWLLSLRFVCFAGILRVFAQKFSLLHCCIFPQNMVK